MCDIDKRLGCRTPEDLRNRGENHERTRKGGGLVDEGLVEVSRQGGRGVSVV